MGKTHRIPLVMTAFGVLLGGCADVKVVKLARDDTTTEGVRYWRPQTLIALKSTTTDKGTVCEAVPFQVQDRTQEYAIQINGGWGTVEANPVLDQGWNLTSLNGKIDSKGPETISAIASLLTAATPLIAPAAKRNGGAQTKAPTCSGIYTIRYNQSGGVEGFTKLDLPL